MTFVETYVGCDERPVLKYWLASQFCDGSDEVIFMVDDDGMTRAEAAGWIVMSRAFSWGDNRGIILSKFEKGFLGWY